MGSSLGIDGVAAGVDYANMASSDSQVNSKTTHTDLKVEKAVQNVFSGGVFDISISIEDAESTLGVINSAIDQGITLTPEQQLTVLQALGKLHNGSFLEGLSALASLNKVASDLADKISEDELVTLKLMSENEMIMAELTKFLNGDDFNLEDPEQVAQLITFLKDQNMFTQSELNEIREIGKTYGKDGALEPNLSDQMKVAELNKIIVDAMHRMNDEGVEVGTGQVFSEGFILNFTQASVMNNAVAATIVYRDDMLNPEVVSDESSFHKAYKDFELVKQLKQYALQAYSLAANT